MRKDGRRGRKGKEIRRRNKEKSRRKSGAQDKKNPLNLENLPTSASDELGQESAGGSVCDCKEPA